MLDEITTTNEDTMAVKSADLKGMNSKQLQKLIDDARAMQDEQRAADIQETREKWQKEAEELGLSVLEILGIREQPKATRKAIDGSRTPAKAKYKLPNGESWSGKGRLPLALRDALKGSDGYSEEDANFDSKESRDAALSKFLI